MLCSVSAAALQISEKQRVRLQRQTVAMTQYCALMVGRSRMMLRFINKECPDDRGDVLTAFRNKYPDYGLRKITVTVTKKMGKSLLTLHTYHALTHSLHHTHYSTHSLTTTHTTQE